MSGARNDPCPCGSGKKYKRCCLAQNEQARDPALTLLTGGRRGKGAPSREEMLASLRYQDLGTRWQASLDPVNISFDDDPAARPAVRLVVAGGLVLGVEIVAHPPAEHAEIALVLAEGIAEAEAVTGRSPELVETRHREVAAALEPLVASRGVTVASTSTLDELDEALTALEANVLAPDAHKGPRTSAPSRWAGWGLPADRVGQVFSAASAFYRAAPWQHIGDDETLTISVAGGRVWYVSVLGKAEETFGLALYGSRLDVEEILSDDASSTEPLSHAHGPVLSFTFGRFDELPRGMFREVRSANWEVAGPSAYPYLIAINTPGGGVTLEQLDDLTTVLGVSERFMTANARAFQEAELRREAPGRLDWMDRSTGAVVVYTGSWVELASLWPLPQRLTTSGAEGRGARPGAYVLDADDRVAAGAEEDARLERYRIWLTRRGTRPPKPESIRRALTIVSDFVMSVFGGGGTVPGLNEVDLRVFLYATYPMFARRNANHERAVAPLGTFFEFLAESERISCPWAAAILADAHALQVRCDEAPRGPSDAPEVAEFFEELSTDLGCRALQAVVSAAESAEDWSSPAARAATVILSREWLRWRDEVIHGGETDPDVVIDALIARRRVWEATPNLALGGLTPAEFVRRPQDGRGVEQ